MPRAIPRGVQADAGAQCPPAILRACAPVGMVEGCYGNESPKGRPGDRRHRNPERSRAFSARYLAGVRGVGSSPSGEARLRCHSPAAILRRRHRCEGAAAFSARYPAGVGAATEFAGSFNLMIIQTVVVERVIVRRVDVRVRRVSVAMVVRVAVMCVCEVRSVVLRQDFRFRQCRRCGLRVVVPPGRFRHPRSRLRHARG